MHPVVDPVDMIHGQYVYQIFGVLTGMPLKKTIKLSKIPEFDNTGDMFITGGCSFTYPGDFSSGLPENLKFTNEAISYDFSYVLQLSKKRQVEIEYWTPIGGIVNVDRPDINFTCVAKCLFGLIWHDSGAVTLRPNHSWVKNSFCGNGFLDRIID